jgi:hypothetical protein
MEPRRWKSMPRRTEYGLLMVEMARFIADPLDRAT